MALVNRDLVMVENILIFFGIERTTAFDVCSYSWKVGCHVLPTWRKGYLRRYVKATICVHSKNDIKSYNTRNGFLKSCVQLLPSFY